MMIAMLMAFGAAESAAALSPAGKWKVDYADSMCLASRPFGTATDSVVFGIRPWPRSDVAEIVLITRERSDTLSGKGSMRLAPSGTVATGTYSSVSDAETGQRVTQLRVTADDIAQLATATTVMITAGSQKVTLAPTAVSGVLTALTACRANLMQSWGLDPREDTLIATEAKEKGGQPSWSRDSKYPSDAFAQGAQGTATIAWTIGIDGRVNQCRVVATSGNASLDSASCAKMKAARYTPATGKDGKAMESHSTARVTWMIR